MEKDEKGVPSTFPHMSQNYEFIVIHEDLRVTHHNVINARNSVTDSVLIGKTSSMTRKRALTSTERSKLCRQRKKQAKEHSSQSTYDNVMINEITSVPTLNRATTSCHMRSEDTAIHVHETRNNIEHHTEIRKRALTSAERCKLSYQRKKQRKKLAKDHSLQRTYDNAMINERTSVPTLNTATTSLHMHSEDSAIHVHETRNNIEQENNGIFQSPYREFNYHNSARKIYEKQFKNDKFGYTCFVCDRLWFESDLKSLNDAQNQVLHDNFPHNHSIGQVACNSCRSALNVGHVPTLCKFNGFVFPPVPNNLPKLDIVSERLISPRLCFMQIRRLRHVNGQFGIFGQIINVPVEVNNMVHLLPRNLDDDHCINVHIKRKLIHKSSYVQGLIKKKVIKAWLQHLITTPLYQMYNVKIDELFFATGDSSINDTQRDEISEDIPIEESLVAQQQTLLWNDDKYLSIAPGEMNVPISLLFDEHAEELSFPAIYIGEFRKFKEGVHATPFMMATSEIRRTDRRAVTPQHLLYMAMKIMRLRVRDSLTVAFKHVGHDTKITRQQIESDDYVNACIEHNLAFLRCIPNSAWYWSQRKKDLSAMIRQLGKPTIFLTMSANEIGWMPLLQILYKLKNNGAYISDEDINLLNFVEKTTLVNEDAVTCAIYFNKLVNVLIKILESKKSSPFGKHYVENYFKRIEFQHRGSPHAHILLWLAEAPTNPLGTDMQEAISLIDKLISVSAVDASGKIKLQTHKHTFTCYKSTGSRSAQKCRFEYPFMPCPSTIILTPMEKTEPEFTEFRLIYQRIKSNLENNYYPDFSTFYREHGIISDEMYHNILRAGIKRPRVFLKRELNEKWHNNFNPFIFNILQSNMDIQFITEEYSCATYVAEYVNKTNRGISNLQQQISTIMNEHPEFNIVEITRKMSIDLLNTVEISSQEAAWVLLRQPMSKASSEIAYIPTVWPIDRQRIRKTHKELEELGINDDCTDIWKENFFDKYENRPDYLENTPLAEFVALYSKKKGGDYCKRNKPRIIRYRNYDLTKDITEYKREMVTLYFPFRSEENDILAEMKFVKIYDDNEEMILNKRKSFESILDIQQTINICKEMCHVDEVNDDVDENNVVTNVPEANPFLQLYRENGEMNDDLVLATLNALRSVVKKRENIMSNDQFNNLMRMANDKQKGLLMHVIYSLLLADRDPIQIFFSGPAGCGKTFVIKLLMEIYNRFCTSDNYCNAYITCASTGKAAVAINGITIHTALKIPLTTFMPLHSEVLQQYNCLFKFVKVVIIDEISMIGAELLSKIDARLKQITGNNACFGGMDMFFIGDLRQLPPVRATPIYKQPKRGLAGPTLWRSLQFYELDQVMRQNDAMFATILTKIGNGEILNENELQLIESRFFTKQEVAEFSPHGIRLFLDNKSVLEYNKSILSIAEDKVVSTGTDMVVGCHSLDQEVYVRQQFRKMSVIDTGGLPYEIILVPSKFYIITSNIDVSDGLANGCVGKLEYIERDDNNELVRLWFEFPGRIGEKIRKKAAHHIRSRSISRTAVPILRRTSSIPMNRNKTIFAKRNHFPLLPACALTIHKSQGGTFDQIVYEYDKSHNQQLLYVALTRVTNINGLYIVNKANDKKFYHGRKPPAGIIELQTEFQRLSNSRLTTRQEELCDLANRSDVTIFSFNCQSLRAHINDLHDTVLKSSTFLLLSETWMTNDEQIHIENFHCVTQYKRPNSTAGGVAVYHSDTDTLHNVNTIQNNLPTNFMQISNQISEIGDVAVVRCVNIHNQPLIIGVLYISPNKPLSNIIQFIHQRLIQFTIEGSDLLYCNYHELPMILAGDFNVNFHSEESQPLIDFLKEKFNLTMNNSPHQSTTRYGTTIDAVFARNLENLQSTAYVSHFSYHKPLLTYLNYNKS